MSKLKFLSIVIIITIPIVCIAGPIYESIRSYAISLYNKGQYREAASQFVAASDIAPINNDLTLWLSKCNRNIALQNNKKCVSKSTSTVKRNRSKLVSNQTNLQKDDFVVYDSIGHYNDDGIALAMLNGKFGYVDKAKKVIVYKQRPKKGTRVKQGHRQQFTRVMINKINTKAKSAKSEATEEAGE